MIDVNYYWIAAGSAVVGYLLFLAMFALLPKRLRSENLQHKAQIINEAKGHAEKLRQEAKARAKAKAKDAIEEMETKLTNRLADLQVSEQEIDSQEEFVKREEARLAKLEKEMEEKLKKRAAISEEIEKRQQEIDGSNRLVIEQLQTQAGVDQAVLLKNKQEDLVQSRQLENQKVLRFLEDDLSTNAKRMATRLLNRVQARYAPVFAWPKAINHVEIPDRKVLDALSAEDSTLIANLREISEGVTIELMNDAENHGPPVIKLVGGFGVFREAARLTLEEILKGHPNSWQKAPAVYEKYRQKIDHQALLMGQKAIIDLNLENIHPEIMRMVGHLNWRTSYRQNQYLHTFEVAQLAGILANELGVDPDLAKRCGLLHDIGKTIDYRIEGSHAVISGDYADRYGENRLICDTVMSHHNDLVLETPLSYVLKAADTLSGARPGARVNLEEGYQIRLSAIDEVVRSFNGVSKVSIMNGGREVHIEFNHKKVREGDLQELSAAIARKIEEDVAYPGQIKVLVSRRFEAVAVA